MTATQAYAVKYALFPAQMDIFR